MASVFVVLCAIFAAVNAGNIAAPGLLGYSAPVVATHAAVASPVISSYHAAAPVAYTGHASAIAVPEISATHENVVRSYGGTFSEYSKGIETPFSSVRKYDSRVNNNVYTPAIAATYAAHAPLATTYAAVRAPIATTYAAHAPVAAHTIAYSPAVKVSHVSFTGLGAHYGW